MQSKRFLSGVLGLIIAFLTAGFIGNIIQKRQIVQQIDRLHRTARIDRDGVFTTDDIASVPDPVQGYFTNVLQEGQEYVSTVRLKQEGKLRSGGADSDWKPFTATQHITVDPPGFLWNATVRLWPLIRLRITDLYRDGNGSAAISLFGVIPLGGDDQNPELNEGELLRYLAEAVWYPTALLPSQGVHWTAIDDSTAMATIEYGGATAMLTFHFTENDEVAKVHAAERPRRVDNGYEPTPWTGHWDDYQTVNGMRIPTTGEVVWHLPEEDMTAWQGQLIDINYAD